MGMTYDELDSTLAAIEMGQTEGVDPVLLSRVRHLVAASDHKRSVPPIHHIHP
jgi:NH3-dependent NAD+ synthetase